MKRYKILCHTTRFIGRFRWTVCVQESEDHPRYPNWDKLATFKLKSEAEAFKREKESDDSDSGRPAGLRAVTA